MGKSAGATPNAPDPAKIIGLQSQADKNAFDYQTQANRINQYSPDGSQTWDKKSTFDEAGYNTALADWNKGNSQGTWVPGTPAGTVSNFIGGGGADAASNSGEVSTAGTPGYWKGATTNNSAAPTRDAFTSNTYDLTTSLSPEQQQLHDLNLSSQTGQAGLLDALTQRLKGSYDQPVDYSGLPAQKSDIGDANVGGYEQRLSSMDPMQFNKDAADAVYNQSNRYFQQDNTTDRNTLEARLSEQGFVPGTPGYDRAMGKFQDTTNVSRADMRDRATTQGFDVGNQAFGNSQSSLMSAISAAMQGLQGRKDSAAFNNVSRAQSLAELLQKRAQPLNELNSVRSGAQVNAPAFGSPSANNANLNNQDVSKPYDTAYQGQIDQYNADQSGKNATTGAIGGIASALAMFF